MAFFLPSYFQKRLLRYALSRLQLVETDELDLDNLGVTLGQRSIIELKDVGLKLKELSTILTLPPTVSLSRARIRLLRITVPADLYASGIIVELKGVHVHLKLQNGAAKQKQKRSQQQPPAGPGRGNKADMPRIFSPEIHDPGGGHARREANRGDFAPAIPSSNDLAESFLQSESQKEREELRAAIASQPQRLEDSVASTSSGDGDVGFGAAEGVSLPSFLANFLRGIENRLQASIKDVALVVEMDLPQSLNEKDAYLEVKDRHRVMIRISEIAVGEHALGAGDSPGTEKRPIRLQDISLNLLSESEDFPQEPRMSALSRLTRDLSNSKSIPAMPSSGKINSTFRPHATASPSSPNSSVGGANISRMNFNTDGKTSPAVDNDHSEVASSRSLLEFMDQSSPDGALEDSALFRSSANSSVYHEQRSNSSSQSNLAFAPAIEHIPDPSIPVTEHSGPSYPHLDLFMSTSTRRSSRHMAGSQPRDDGVDNQGHAELLARIGRIDTSVHSEDSIKPASEDLTQSRIFSHDEAESMYMSAVGKSVSASQSRNAMPGGWDWAEPSISQSDRSQDKPAQDTNTVSYQQVSPHAASGGVLSATRQAAASSMPLSLGSAKPAREEIRSVTRPDVFDDLSLTAKRLLTIDRITVRIPSRDTQEKSAPAPQTNSHNEKNSTRPDPKYGSSVNDSYYSEAAGSLFQSECAAPERRPQVPSKGRELDPPNRPSSGTLEVQILNVQAQFDVLIGKFLVKGTKKFQDVFETGLEAIPNPPSKKSPSIPPLALEISNVILKFREHVSEQALSLPVAALSAARFNQFPTEKKAQTHSSTFLPPEVPQIQANYLLDDDFLLQLTFSQVKYSMSHDLERAKQRLTVSKMSLSHAAGDILSCSQEIKMRESVRDLSAWAEGDLLMTLESARRVTKIAVQTKPVYLRIDLLRLDDILSRSGGLSSLLELGNSIVSTSTVRSSPRKPERENHRAQGVHFEKISSDSKIHESNGSIAGKINVRVAGALIELVGSQCAMKLRSSAIKIVYRQEGLGIQIDKVVLDGPFTSGREEESDVNVDLSNIRVEYLPVPKEADLDRLLSILTPSKNKYDKDDDIMVDTLLRQRRKGGVLRVTVGELKCSISELHQIPILSKLGVELGKLSTVTKYLPEDDRPGILTLALIQKLDHRMHLNDFIGNIRVQAELVEGAHVNVPSLMAAQVSTLSFYRNEDERLFGEVTTSTDSQSLPMPPMIMCRFIADEMEPTVKLKLFNACLEYHIPTITALLELNNSTATSQVSSDKMGHQASLSPTSTTSSIRSQSTANFTKRAKIAVAIRDSALGLNPHGLDSKCLVVLTDASLSSSFEGGQESTASLEIKKASIMIIDSVARITSTPNRPQQQVYFDPSDQVQYLTASGFVPVGYISSASAVIKLQHANETVEQILDVELRNNLFILETCADSTQTLISILNSLSPPIPPSKESKYRTEIVPIEDMLASFTGDAYFAEPGSATGLRASSASEPDGNESKQQEIEYVSEFYNQETEDEANRLTESYITSDLSESIASISVAPVSVRESVIEATQDNAMTHSLLDFREDHFARNSVVGGTAHRWDSAQNTYGLASEKQLRECPVKIRVRDIHVIWNMFDGYDWQSTRDTISQAVKDIEIRASTKRTRSNSRPSPGVDDDEGSVIGDFLFNSIYIGIPAHKDPRELANEINRNLDDGASDTGSYATTTTITGSPARQGQSRVRQKKLKLNRSKQHKMTFELNGISADFLVFPTGLSEVQSSIDVRVKSLEVFDHVPTSTWKKFATYMQDAGERQTDTSMIHLEILNVKPVADLAASEMILKMTVLPLRLHVDQDALDFMSRFFEFKDERAPAPSAPSSPPFLQRVEINPIRIKLDFKPKRVDYGGLRSGRTTEFMNFFVLDQADMVLRRVILYGVSGYDRLGIMLNNIWTPDVRSNQLPGILAGLAPIRSLVNVGSGVKDLVVVPMNEYKKDGRIVRSIQKGAMAFAKTTTKELVNLGAKLAIGTQAVLQNTETMLGPGATEDKWDGTDDDEESKKQISLYADQPVGVVQGLRGAYASLERDLLLARDAIVAVPGEVMASGSASGAAKALLKQTPTIILRPAIGATKAVGQTLLGAGNSLDRENWRRMDEKYKKH